MKTPEDLEERSRRDALVEPLFGGLGAAQAGDEGSGESSDPRADGPLAWRGPLLLLLLMCLALWLLL